MTGDEDVTVTLVAFVFVFALAFVLEIFRRRWLKRQAETWEAMQPQIDAWAEQQRNEFVERYGVDPFADYIDAEEEIGSDVDTVVIEREERDNGEGWNTETDRVERG